MGRQFFLPLLFLGLSGCGVKTSVVAPQRPAIVVPPNLDCSPKDPKCDRTDANYRPSTSK